MKMIRYADALKTWAGGKGIALTAYEVDLKPPKSNQLGALKAIHPELVKLYEDSNGVLVCWGDEEQDLGGILSIPDHETMVEQIESERDLMAQFDDASIINGGYQKEWWTKNLAIFRSLIKFHDEGNGDGLWISTINDGVYFLFHDWMDWTGDEPPMFVVAPSMDQLYENWSAIQFANAKDLTWLSAIKDGKFTGFNAAGFAVVE